MSFSYLVCTLCFGYTVSKAFFKTVVGMGCIKAHFACRIFVFVESKDAASKMGLNATHAYYSLEKGFAYCITEAESADKVREAHASVDIPLEDVIEVKTVS